MVLLWGSRTAPFTREKHLTSMPSNGDVHTRERDRGTLQLSRSMVMGYVVGSRSPCGSVDRNIRWRATRPEGVSSLPMCQWQLKMRHRLATENATGVGGSPSVAGPP